MKAVCAALALVSLLVVRPFAQAAPDAVGDWEITTVSPVGESSNTLVIGKTADGYTAAAKNERGQRPYDSIKVDGKNITLTLTVDFQGQAMLITYTGTIEETRMGGDADFGGMAQGTWSAVRKPAADK